MSSKHYQYQLLHSILALVRKLCVKRLQTRGSQNTVHEKIQYGDGYDQLGPIILNNSVMPMEVSVGNLEW
jgi:phage-related protein